MFVRLCAALAVTLGVIASTPAAPAPLAKVERRKTQDDLALMQGTWKMVEQGGPGFNNGLAARIAFKRGTQMKVKITDKTFAYLYFNGNGYTESTKYEISTNARSFPREIDLVYRTGNYTMTMKGIYKLEGKRLTIVYVQTYTGLEGKRGGLMQQNMARPTAFDASNPNAMQMILERE